MLQEKMAVAELYRWFARREARGVSSLYEILAEQVASDTEVLASFHGLPLHRVHPNLVFAVVRYLGEDLGDYQRFRHFLLHRSPEVRALLECRTVQTNEPRRCAPILPLLAALPQPLALLEVGASAGLCLYPDLYDFEYRTNNEGLMERDSMFCEVTGPVPLPSRRLEVVWRAGIDINPLDVHRKQDLEWLEALVWPEQRKRLARLRHAADIVSKFDQGSPVSKGDLSSDFPALLSTVPSGATIVIFHSSVLGYVAEQHRREFSRTVRGLPGHWIAQEPREVFQSITDEPTVPAGRADHSYLVTLDGKPMALSAPDGGAVQWIGNDKRGQ